MKHSAKGKTYGPSVYVFIGLRAGMHICKPLFHEKLMLGGVPVS
jgi:hypothetical protein